MRGRGLCAYNRDRACHALAITVGDILHAHCDTFFTSPAKGGDRSATGRVGACKMSDCRHNIDFECRAPASPWATSRPRSTA
ncbi:hypothetical protein RB628_28850 [Streptomyces sp. ADMS]|uniref:DUF1540 domain-containing protein n=1 Tax=Streptomyces sp. ADMS TaxID=3071415 RepID=UPI00296EF141|nr:DUF1540 domain-containing protein [Streptomyces sp. ADMS]MDW4909241.1 hypothetical protein [Streptomyces sp. ADMS]